MTSQENCQDSNFCTFSWCLLASILGFTTTGPEGPGAGAGGVRLTRGQITDGRHSEPGITALNGLKRTTDCFQGFGERLQTHAARWT